MQSEVLSTAMTSGGRKLQADSGSQISSNSARAQQSADSNSWISQSNASSQRPADSTSHISRKSASPQRPADSTSHISRRSASPQRPADSTSNISRRSASPQWPTDPTRKISQNGASPQRPANFNSRSSRSSASPQRPANFNSQSSRSSASPQQPSNFNSRSSASPQRPANFNSRSSASPQRPANFNSRSSRSSASPQRPANFNSRSFRSSASPQRPANFNPQSSQSSASSQWPVNFNSRISRSGTSPQRPANSSLQISRSNASPQRSTFASCSSSPSAYNRHGASPNLSASGNPKLRPLPSSCRSSTSTTRSLTPSARSSRPTLQRSHTAPRRQQSSVGRGGESSGKTRHGGSSSKIQAWQFDISELSSEKLSNLRTTLPDCSASHLGRLSSALRHETENRNRPSRQSFSPRISTQTNSTNSHDSDHLSFQSKSLGVSSCEDEVDSMDSEILVNKSVKKTTYPESMVGCQFTRKQELNSNRAVQPVSKKRVELLATNVSGGAESVKWQMDLRRDSRSVFKPLLSSQDDAPFYIHKASSLQYQRSSINSSVATSSNASSEQGVCITPYTEGSDRGAEDIENEPVQSTTSFCQKEISAFDSMEVKWVDGRRYSTGSDGLLLDDTICLEQAVIQDLPIHSQEGDVGCRTCEVSICNLDARNTYEPLLDGGVNARNTHSVKVADGYYTYQNLDMGHVQLVEDGHDINEERQSFLQFEKNIALNSNSKSLVNCCVGLQEDDLLKCISTKNANDGTSENLQAVQSRTFELNTMRKHDHELRREITMHETSVTQANETDLVQSLHSVDGHPLCLQDTGHKLYAEESIQSNHTNLMSKIKGAEICSEDRDSLEIMDSPSPYMLEKGAFDHEVEPSIVCLTSGELPSKVKGSEEPALPAEIIGPSNLLQDYSDLRRSGNDFKSLTMYLTIVSVLDTCPKEQKGVNDSSQISCWQTDLESMTNISSHGMLSDASMPAAVTENNIHQIPVCSENVSERVFIDYCLDSSETSVETKTVRHTASASKSLSDSLQNSASGMDVLVGQSSLPAGVEGNMHQRPVHSEDASDEDYLDNHLIFSEMTNMSKARKLKHTSDASKFVSEESENIPSTSNINMLSGISITCSELESIAHESPVHGENVHEKVCIDYSLDVSEMTATVTKEALVHYGVASEGLPDGMQDVDLDSLPVEGSICLPPELITKDDVEINFDHEVSACNQEEKRLVNDFSISGEQVDSHTCMDSCKKFGTNLQAASSIVEGRTQFLVVSAEHERGNITGINLETEKTCGSIQTTYDLTFLDENAIAQEIKGDGMHESQINFQPETACPTNNLNKFQTEERHPESETSKGCRCNKYNAVESKYLSGQDSADRAGFSTGKNGVNRDASRGCFSRSLTLAEATDTVLFCSSIVHNLIDKAAAIGMDKESLVSIVNPSPMSEKEHGYSSLSGQPAAGHTSFKAKSRRQQVSQDKIHNNVMHRKTKPVPVVQVVTIPQRDAIAHAKRKNPKCCCTVI